MVIRAPIDKRSVSLSHMAICVNARLHTHAATHPSYIVHACHSYHSIRHFTSIKMSSHTPIQPIYNNEIDLHTRAQV